MSLRKKLLKINACKDGMEWLADQTAPDAWANCKRGDWMLWVASRCGVDLQTITLTKVRCARLVQHLMQDQRSLHALDVAEQFALGAATREQLADAADAAADAYAYNSATAAAAYAAYAAADGAAYTAYAADAAYAYAYEAAYAPAYAAAAYAYAYADAYDAATAAADAAGCAAGYAAGCAAIEKILAQCADICRETIALKVVLAGLATNHEPLTTNRGP